MDINKKKVLSILSWMFVVFVVVGPITSLILWSVMTGWKKFNS